MHLIGQLEAILKHEGLKRKTRDDALRQTFTYHQRYEKRLIELAKEKTLSEDYLQGLVAAQSMLKSVMRGKTTYQKEWEKVEKDPEKGLERKEQDIQYRKFERIFTIYTFGGFFDEIDEQVKMLDETIQRLYLTKPKKRKPYDPEL